MEYILTPFGVKRLVDGAEIPFADGNTDYEAYKLWLKAGNVPGPPSDARPAIVDDYLNRREIIINRLVRIALFETDAGIIPACRSFRNALLNLPQQPAVQAAADIPSLRAAIDAEINKAIAAAKAIAPTAGALFDKVVS